MLSLRPHYAETLRLWRERFLQRRNAVSALGFDDVFQRMWELYLAYSEAGFRSGYLDVYQWTFAPTGSSDLDELRRRFRWGAGDPGRRLRRHLPDRPPHRPLQRRRRHVGGRASSPSPPSRPLLGTGDAFRRLLLLALVAVWGLRLAWHMIGKSAGKGEDPRYDALLKGDFSAVNVLRKIFLLQAVATWFISLPIQLSATLGPTPTALLPVLVAGVAVWVVGVALRSRRGLPTAPVQGRSRKQGRHHGPRAVGVDSPPQLLRRRRRVVGALAGHHRRLVVAVDGVVAGR